MKREKMTAKELQFSTQLNEKLKAAAEQKKPLFDLQVIPELDSFNAALGLSEDRCEALSGFVFDAISAQEVNEFTDASLVIKQFLQEAKTIEEVVTMVFHYGKHVERSSNPFAGMFGGRS